MADLAVIGGTGLTDLPGLSIEHEEMVQTPYGPPSGPLVHGVLDGVRMVFLPRHGPGHRIAPHRINYRANLRALERAGCTEVVAVAAVGGIAGAANPGTLVVPNQIVDYTWGRDHTFFDQPSDGLQHVDFTSPYDASLRARILLAAERAEVAVIDGGVYGATQGPRLESAAEIDRMERDGCTLVGMTGMPEAALARELGMAYAHCTVVVNEAAGRGPGEITMEEIARHLEHGMAKVLLVLKALVSPD